jgi:ketosteroid isomerase-like protein
MRRIGRGAVGVVALSLACQAAEMAETPEQMQARIEQESVAFRAAIADVEAKYEQFEAAGLADSVASLYTEDAVAAFANQPPAAGRQAIRDAGVALYALGMASVDIRSASAVANGPVGVERGTYVFNFTPGPNAPPGMAAMFPDSGSYLTHWRLVDGKWLIAGLVVNSMKPLPGMGM